MMKQALIIGLALVLLLLTGCFASPDEEASAPTVTTTAPSVTTTVAPTVTTTTAPAAISEYPCTAYATDSLNVRRTPNTDYHAVGGLHEGEQVTVIGREGDFYQINFKWSDTDENGQAVSGTTAYVSAQYISLSRTTATTTVPTVANPTVATTTTTTAAS
ncbi:MAG: SH3 domain-containing protein [Clostridia bacterium]|nr:SH3 domain-containing protein [Clostridia bacterium]